MNISPGIRRGGEGGGSRSLLQTRVRVREEVLAGRDILSVSKSAAEERTLAYLKPCYELLEDMFKGGAQWGPQCVGVGAHQGYGHPGHTAG